MLHAIPVTRGCGSRKAGGCYVECGVSDDGSGLPVEDFLVDPPQPMPEGLDLINKPQVWQATPESVPHLLIWIGREYYPHVADFIEESRLYGISRRIGGAFDASRLIPGASRLVLVHPRALVEGWEDIGAAQECRKGLRGHDITSDLLHALEGAGAGAEDGERVSERKVIQLETAVRRARRSQARARVAGVASDVSGESADREGPCLFKAYDLIPTQDGELLLDTEQTGGLPVYGRTFTEATSYAYTPTGEQGQLVPAIFGVFPISGFAFIKREDGSVNEEARARVEAAGFEYYESDN